MEITTLCYLKKDDCYLMLLRNKEKNDINHNKWLGIGGHVEENETVENANIREVKEETGLTIKKAIKRGVIYFHCESCDEIMHLFTSDEFSGEVIECDEGSLKWIKINEILNLNLWEGDRYFLKELQNNNKYFEMEFFYENDKLVKYKRIK